MSALHVHVIGDVNRGSLMRVVSDWSGRLPVAVLPAVAADDLECLGWAFDADRFQARQGRRALPKEVGSAMAHVQSCRALLDGRGTWALVLEDDAVVDDPERLLDRARTVTAAVPDERPTIYSFFTTRAVRTARLPAGPVPRSWRMPVSVGSCVGYLVNRAAAAIIVDNQRPIGTVADWPVHPPTVDFCFDGEGLVGHDDGTGSAAAIPEPPDPLRRPSLLARAEIWSWVWYVRNRRHFDGPSDYRRRMVSPRAFYHRRMRGLRPRTP